MKKIFLASVFAKVADEFARFITEPPASLTVAFIPTASDQSTDPWYVRDDLAKLVDMGFNIKMISLSNISQATLEAELQTVDIIFVAGGNTFYLLQEARSSGFMAIVPPLIEQGKIYVGSSAGSYLACPTIEVAGWKHQDRNKVGLTNLEALCLIPVLLSVHYQSEYDESLREGMRQTKLPVRIITDDQALAITGDSEQLVGRGKLVALL
jgi:dipeptidase E